MVDVLGVSLIKELGREGQPKRKAFDDAVHMCAVLLVPLDGTPSINLTLTN